MCHLGLDLLDYLKDTKCHSSLLLGMFRMHIIHLTYCLVPYDTSAAFSICDVIPFNDVSCPVLGLK